MTNKMNDNNLQKLRKNNIFVFSGLVDMLIGGYFIASTLGFIPNWIGIPVWITGIIGLFFFLIGIWTIAWRLAAGQIEDR